MKEDITFFEDKPFDNRIVEHLDMKSIEAALDEGNKCLHYQFETIGRVRSNCTIILGWLIGAMLALMGYIALGATSAHPEPALLITAIYELAFCFATAFSIIYGAMYKRTVHAPGDSPSHFIRDSILNPLQSIENKSKYILGWHLSEIQFKIMQNTAEQVHEVKVYRRALALILIALLSGGMFLTILLVYL